MQFNIHDAKTQLSRLLEMVEQGETVTIARHGMPIADLVPTRSASFPLGAGCGSLLVPPGDEWWQPMTDHEAEDWIDGK